MDRRDWAKTGYIAMVRVDGSDRRLLVYVPVDERSNLESTKSIGGIVLGPPSTNNDHTPREDYAFETPFGFILIALNESDALPAGYFLDRGHSVHVTCAIEKEGTVHPTTQNLVIINASFR